MLKLVPNKFSFAVPTSDFQPYIFPGVYREPSISENRLPHPIVFVKAANVAFIKEIEIFVAPWTIHINASRKISGQFLFFCHQAPSNTRKRDCLFSSLTPGVAIRYFTCVARSILESTLRIASGIGTLI